ncbi:MAG: hypothetical protein RIS25_1076 [Actinomycetota bacterium]
MSHSDQQTGTLAQSRVGTWGIIFFVISAAAPLTVVAGSFPVAFLFGGVGLPAAMLAAGIVLILFASGFTAMSRYVKNAGAFYAYAAKGLGKPAGVGIALTTLMSYIFLSVSFYGLIGFFGNITSNAVFGTDIPWWVFSAVAAVTIFVLSRSGIDVGAKVLGILLVAEVGIVLILVAAIFVTGGPEALTLEPLSPNAILSSPAPGVLFVFAFGAFLGFEGTAVYAEEAKDPNRSVPRATFGAVAFLALFYSLAAIAFVYGFGATGIMEFLTDPEGDFTALPYAMAGTFVGDWLVSAMLIMIVTSFFACLLAFHNASARYIFSMGREKLIPQSFAVTNGKGSPMQANLVLVAIAGVAILATAVTGGDPYMVLAIGPYAMGTAGLVFAQAVAAFAVVGFFARNRRGHNVWRVLILPSLGALGLAAAWIAIVQNFQALTGWDPSANLWLILPVPALFVAGILWASIVKKQDPARYESLVSEL